VRDLFPGYFEPTGEEFDKLWKDATFAFDASVLLGLYRLTAEARPAFFEVMDKLGDRIFLPYQAAHEYLRNRLNAISAYSASHHELKRDAQKFVADLRARVRDHSMARGEEIVNVADSAVSKILEIVDTTLEKEPDLLESDGLRLRLVRLFQNRTGKGLEYARLQEIYKQAAGRFERKVPPGYKDQNKPEPERYGDVVIWFELLEYATKTQKPIIFVTRDTKEDWWLEHTGKTVGPRPELVQEFKHVAGGRFYMYTTPRFIEFAQRFFDLTSEPAKKATSELEEIEKQDRQAVYINQSAGGGYTDTYNTMFINQLAAQPPSVTFDVDSLNFVEGFVNSATYSPLNWASPEHDATRSKYLWLLPFNGQTFGSARGKWQCEVVDATSSVPDGRIIYRLKFEPQDRTKQVRNLTLSLSYLRLERDLDWAYKRAIVGHISEWLGNSPASDGFSSLT
jgi:PIN like domain